MNVIVMQRTYDLEVGRVNESKIQIRKNGD